GAGDLDPLGEAGIARRGGVDRAEGAAREPDRAAAEILRLHPVEARRAGEGGDLDDRTDEALEEVERVDRLRHQDAAAVARQRAAPRLVVVALRPPPADEA